MFRISPSSYRSSGGHGRRRRFGRFGRVRFSACGLEGSAARDGRLFMAACLTGDGHSLSADLPQVFAVSSRLLLRTAVIHHLVPARSGAREQRTGEQQYENPGVPQRGRQQVEHHGVLRRSKGLREVGEQECCKKASVVQRSKEHPHRREDSERRGRKIGEHMLSRTVSKKTIHTALLLGRPVRRVLELPKQHSRRIGTAHHTREDGQRVGHGGDEP